jgi:hypothetical protein
MITLHTYTFDKSDGLRTYKYFTEFGWLDLAVYPDGSNTIHCEDTSFKEIQEIVKLVNEQLQAHGIELI